MPQPSNILVQCITYCLLIGLTYALDGKLVKAVKGHKFPFVVSLSRKSNSQKYEHTHFCTGTLIRPRNILTTAFCLKRKRPDDIEIIAGSVKLEQGKKYHPESWITFDQWNAHHGNINLTNNNLAIIKLKGNGITDIHPAEVFSMNTIHVDDRYFTITGWGETLKRNKVTCLRRGLVKILSNDECRARGLQLKGSELLLPHNYFCTKADPYVLMTCGDGGAPIFNKEEKLVGISIGTCPNLLGYQFDPTVYLPDYKMNAHINIFYYNDFIRNV